MAKTAKTRKVAAKRSRAKPAARKAATQRAARSRPPLGKRRFEDRLDRLAEIAVKVGLGLRSGQEIVMTAPVEALPLARRITAHAYKAGASLVTTLFGDDVATLLRFQHAPDASFDRATGWLFDGMAAAYRSGA